MSLVDHFNSEVTRFYTIMEQHKIDIQPTDLALFQTLGPTLRQLKETVDTASETKDDDISRFSFELEKVMGDLLAEVAEIRNKAQDPMVLNPNAKSESVLQFLDELLDQMEKLESSKAMYSSWSDLFKSGGVSTIGEKKEAPVKRDESKAAEIEETKTEIELKRILWKSLNEWDSITMYALAGTYYHVGRGKQFRSILSIPRISPMSYRDI